ncbi:MAG: metal-dependent hydrolase [Salinigranum sp.]
MWPWEHVAFAYVLYSLCSRAWRGEPPGGHAVFALSFGSLFPDLIDKPLAWTFGVFDSGYAVGHSAVALPVLAAAVLVPLARLDRRSLGVAFLFGHVSHLVGDVIYPYLEGGRLAFSILTWPAVRPSASGARAGFVSQFLHYFVAWWAQVRTLHPGPILLFEGTLGALVFSLWVADGAPGAAEVGSGVAAVRSALAGASLDE